MSTDLAVLVRLDAQASSLRELIRALDEQSLAPSRFEVILCGASGTGTPGRRIADLVGRRPNLGVAPDVTSALASTAATWVTVFDVRDLALRSEAYERLVAQGAATGCSVVLGRVDLADGRELNDVLARDAGPVQVSAETALGAVIVQRRESAATHGLITDLESASTALSAASDVAVVGSYQCGSRTTGMRGVQRLQLALDSATARWQDGVLEIRVGGQVEPGTSGEVLLAARAVDSGDDHWLPSTGAIDEDGAFTATARLDPATSAGGRPIADGRWAFTVGVHGHDDRFSERARVGAVLGAPGAVVQGRPVVVETNGPSLVLDVNATKSSIVRRPPVSDVDITETYRGTLLRAALPDVAIAPADSATGLLRLDKFVLPARIVATDSGAALECYLSGLAGASHLSSRFGLTTASMGLQLTISGTGEMSVRAQDPPAPPKKAAKKVAKKAVKKVAPAKKAPAKKAPHGIQRLRRALPKALDPTIARIRRNPTAARLYRRAAGLDRRSSSTR